MNTLTKVVFLCGICTTIACDLYSNCIDATDYFNVTNSTYIAPIIGYVYHSQVYCEEMSCNITETLLPIID